MAYNERLAERVRAALSKRTGIVEKEMFGGTAFMLRGHMCCGVLKDDLVVRVGPVNHDAAVSRPHVRVMDFTRRPIKGYVYVAPAGTRTAAQLGSWLKLASDFVASLPPKKPKRGG